jgi:excisionase family DNA binding protein
MEKFIHLPDKDSLTVREVANAMGMHVSSVWRHILHGIRGHKLRAIRVGGRRRVLRSDLEAFLEDLNSVRDEVHREIRREQQEDQVRAANRVLEALLAEGL